MNPDARNESIQQGLKEKSSRKEGLYTHTVSRNTWKRSEWSVDDILFLNVGEEIGNRGIN